MKPLECLGTSTMIILVDANKDNLQVLSEIYDYQGDFLKAESEY